MKTLLCFSGKVISEFSLLNPQNNKKPLVTYFSVGGLSLLAGSVFARKNPFTPKLPTPFNLIGA
jgi:hypothetical protein